MSEISKIKVITLTPFISSEYHLWTASALASFKVYKVDKLVLGTENEPQSDDKFDATNESHLQSQANWEERNTVAIEQRWQSIQTIRAEGSAWIGRIKLKVCSTRFDVLKLKLGSVQCSMF